MDDGWHVPGLSVGQVAERMGITPVAVRWYADQGLLPCERTSTNQRRFFEDVLCRVAMVRAGQRAGLTLEQIRGALSHLTPGVAPTRQDWDRLAAHLREDVGRHVDDLLVVLAELDPRAPAPPA